MRSALSPARRELHRSYSAASKTRIETEAKTVSKPANRSADLPSALKTSSTRVRNELVKNGDAVDKAVTQKLPSNEWSGHHLIPIKAIKDNQDLFAKASEVPRGFRTDESTNLTALPNAAAAQTTLKANGIDRPIHNSGHSKTIDDVNAQLQVIEARLRAEGLTPESPGYGQRANELSAAWSRTYAKVCQAPIASLTTFTQLPRSFRTSVGLKEILMYDHDFWLLRQDPQTLYRRLTAFEEDASLGMINAKEIEEAHYELLCTRSIKIEGDPLIPAGSPQPIMALPADFAPDYFELEDCMFVSQRFRDALAQPADVVQYWPVELTEASEAAWRQDYLMLRILAWQPAMDLFSQYMSRRR